MYVYELAIQIGKKSSELSDASEHLGMGSLTAASEMTPEQHHRLLQHFTGQAIAAPPPAPGAGSPLAFGPPGLAAPPSGSPLGSPGGVPGGVPLGAIPPPPPRPASGGRQVRLPMVIVAVLAVFAVLGGGAYLVMSAGDQKLADAAAKRRAAEERESAARLAEDDAAAAGTGDDPAAVERERTHIARCAAMQKIVEVDRSIQGSLQYGDISFPQWRFAVDKLVSQRQDLDAAHADLRAASPTDQHHEVDVLASSSDELVSTYDSIRTYEQLSVLDGIGPLLDRYEGARDRMEELNDDCELYYG